MREDGASLIAGGITISLIGGFFYGVFHLINSVNAPQEKKEFVNRIVADTTFTDTLNTQILKVDEYLQIGDLKLEKESVNLEYVKLIEKDEDNIPYFRNSRGYQHEYQILTLEELPSGKIHYVATKEVIPLPVHRNYSASYSALKKGEELTSEKYFDAFVKPKLNYKSNAQYNFPLNKKIQGIIDTISLHQKGSSQ